MVSARLGPPWARLCQESALAPSSGPRRRYSPLGLFPRAGLGGRGGAGGAPREPRALRSASRVRSGRRPFSGLRGKKSSKRAPPRQAAL